MGIGPTTSLLHQLMEKHKEHKTKTILSRGKTFRESEIICPHCAEIMSHDFWDKVPEYQEIFETVECEKCEKEFKLKWDYSFSTKK